MSPIIILYGVAVTSARDVGPGGMVLNSVQSKLPRSKEIGQLAVNSQHNSSSKVPQAKHSTSRTTGAICGVHSPVVSILSGFALAEPLSPGDE